MNRLPPPLRDAPGFARFIVRRWSEDRCPQVAGSLTFTTLLALVPVFTLVVALLSTTPLFEPVMIQLKIFLLLNLVPEIAGKIITVYMGQFAEAAGRITAMSLAFLLVTSLAMFHTVDRALNGIWRVRAGRPLWLSLAGYLMLLAVGPLLLGLSVSVTTYLHALSAASGAIPDPMQPVLLHGVSVVATGAILFLVYRIVPHRHVPWGHAAAGGLLAAVLFESMKEGFAAYVRAIPSYNLVYGAFAAIPIFLISVYLSWLAVLLGAEVAAGAAYWRGGRWKRGVSPGQRLADAFAIGRVLGAPGSTPLALEAIEDRADVPAETLELVLDHLVARGVVRRTGSSNYALAKPREEITAADFYFASAAPGDALDAQTLAQQVPELAQAILAFEAQLRRPLPQAPGAGAQETPSGR